MKDYPPSPSKKKKKKKGSGSLPATTIWVCYHYYGVVLPIYSSYNTQITTKFNQFFLVLLWTPP